MATKDTTGLYAVCAQWRTSGANVVCGTGGIKRAPIRHNRGQGRRLRDARIPGIQAFGIGQHAAGAVSVWRGIGWTTAQRSARIGHTYQGMPSL